MSESSTEFGGGKEVSSPMVFGYMCLCLSPDDSGGIVTLRDVLLDHAAPHKSRLEVALVVGLIRRNTTHAPVRLDAMTYWIDRVGVAQRIRGNSGIATSHVPPGPSGPTSILFELDYPVERTGLHGVTLFDPGGAFGIPNRQLATCQFLLRAR